MTDYLAKAKSPLSFKTEPPLLKILDFGGCMLLFQLILLILLCCVTNFLKAFHQGEARPPTLYAIGVHSPEIIFSFVALGDNNPNWDVVPGMHG